MPDDKKKMTAEAEDAKAPPKSRECLVRRPFRDEDGVRRLPGETVTLSRKFAARMGAAGKLYPEGASPDPSNFVPREEEADAPSKRSRSK